MKAMVLVVLLCAVSKAFACLEPPKWTPPTTRSAYGKANLVIYVRVLSQNKMMAEGPFNRLLAGVSEIEVEILKVFKGFFQGRVVKTDTVRNGGLGSLDIGTEYVLFMNSSHAYLRYEEQPWCLRVPYERWCDIDGRPWCASTQQVIKELNDN